MPKTTKKTFSGSGEMNDLKTDMNVDSSYYSGNIGEDSSFTPRNPEDGFTDFINRIDARKVRARPRIFIDNSN